MDRVTVRESNGPPLERHYFTIPEVFAYIRELFEWDDPISKELRDLPIERGFVFAFLPAGFSLERPADIKWDHESLKGRRSETYELVARFVSDYLRRHHSALAFFQSDWHEGDPILDRLTTPYVLLAETSESRKAVCHFLNSTDASNTTVANAFKEARPFTFLAVLTTVPKGWSLRHRDELPADQASILARAAQHVIVDAFDGMAHFIWSKHMPSERGIAL